MDITNATLFEIVEWLKSFSSEARERERSCVVGPNLMSGVADRLIEIGHEHRMTAELLLSCQNVETVAEQADRIALLERQVKGFRRTIASRNRHVNDLRAKLDTALKQISRLEKPEEPVEPLELPKPIQVPFYVPGKQTFSAVRWEKPDQSPAGDPIDPKSYQMTVCPECCHEDSLENFDVVGACNDNVFCNACFEEFDPETGRVHICSKPLTQASAERERGVRCEGDVPEKPTPPSTILLGENQSFDDVFDDHTDAFLSTGSFVVLAMLLFLAIVAAGYWLAG